MKILPRINHVPLRGVYHLYGELPFIFFCITIIVVVIGWLRIFVDIDNALQQPSEMKRGGEQEAQVRSLG